MSRPINPLYFAAAAAGLTAGALVTMRSFRSTPIAPGSVILITGGSRGLGFAIASRFARQPVRLVLAARSREGLEEAQAKLLAENPHLTPDDFYLVDADLAKPEECRRMVAEALRRYGRIDVLVNNAGIIEVGPIEAQSAEAFERAMQINFFAAMHVTWAALPHLYAQPPLAGSRRAAIVNIASLGGKLAVPHMLPYSASKFALVGFSEGLHAELRAKNIRVTTVCPGLMRTGGEAHAQFVGDKDAEKKWFDFAAKTPGVATTAEYAAKRIYAAVVHGRAEITISPQAWIAARFAGLAPETTQCLNALVNQYALPPAP
ncbi:MAG: SDR family oxidoreductase [Bryocella sp.]